MHQRLGFGVAIQRHREIGIAREPRLRPRGNRQSTDQSEGNASLNEVGIDTPKDRFERGHAVRSVRSTRRPGLSPCSAPGRSRSHC